MIIPSTYGIRWNNRAYAFYMGTRIRYLVCRYRPMAQHYQLAAGTLHCVFGLKHLHSFWCTWIRILLFSNLFSSETHNSLFVKYDGQSLPYIPLSFEIILCERAFCSPFSSLMYNIRSSLNINRNELLSTVDTTSTGVPRKNCPRTIYLTYFGGNSHSDLRITHSRQYFEII